MDQPTQDDVSEKLTAITNCETTYASAKTAYETARDSFVCPCEDGCTCQPYVDLQALKTTMDNACNAVSSAQDDLETYLNGLIQ